MLQRFVFAKLSPEWSHPDGVADTLARGREVLSTIPEVRGFRAGTPVGEAASRGWDLVFVLDFDTQADIDSYFHGDPHQRFLKETLGPRTEAKRVWNFQMQ